MRWGWRAWLVSAGILLGAGAMTTGLLYKGAEIPLWARTVWTGATLVGVPAVALGIWLWAEFALWSWRRASAGAGGRFILGGMLAVALGALALFGQEFKLLPWVTFALFVAFFASPFGLVLAAAGAREAVALLSRGLRK